VALASPRLGCQAKGELAHGSKTIDAVRHAREASAQDDAGVLAPLPAPGTLEPIYALTEGVGQAFLTSLVSRAVDEFAERLEDPLASEILEAHDLPPLPAAVVSVHHPRSEAA
jgi:RecG-like helicase